MFNIARKLKSDRNQTLSRYRELSYLQFLLYQTSAAGTFVECLKQGTDAELSHKNEKVGACFMEVSIKPAELTSLLTNMPMNLVTFHLSHQMFAVRRFRERGVRQDSDGSPAQ